MSNLAKYMDVEALNIDKIMDVSASNIASVNGIIFPPPTPASKWASWNELSESGLASDDIYVAMMENTSAAGNETGQGGGLTGADLVLTQVGSIAGATGSPPSRYVSRTGGDYFNLTTAAATSMITGTDYTLVMKCHTITSNSSAAEFYDAGRGHMVLGYTKCAGLYCNGGGGGEVYVDCAAQPSSSGDFYLFLTSKAGKALYAGWSLTKPTDLADIPANQKVSTSVRNWSAGSWANRHSLAARTTAGSTTMYIYYVVLTKSEIISIP